MQFNYPLIDAFWQPTLGINTFKNCLALVDLEGNTEYKLVCASFTESNACLKIFKGTTLFAETVLPEIPCAVTTFYTDSNDLKIPAIAVACGSQVLVYRNVRPFFKFSLPLIENEDTEATNVESDIWKQKFDTQQLVQLLQDLSMEHGFSNLSTPSQKLLAMNQEDRENFLKAPGNAQIKKQVTITAMSKIAKLVEGEKVVECLIVGTESSHMFVLDPETFSIVAQKKLPGIITHLVTQGIYTVEYSIIFCTRQGSVYIMKRDVNEAKCLTHFSSLPIDIALETNRFVTVHMDSTFQGYTLKGAKEWSISLNGFPVAISVMPQHISESTFLICCNRTRDELVEGFVYVFKGTEMIYSLHVQEPIQAFIYGPYGFGEQAFIFNTTGGGLSIKLLKRTANFGSSDKCALLASSSHHNIKLTIPKKSSIFSEQVLRERDSGQDMYSCFQKSWLGMKVLVCESYLNALNSSSISEKHNLNITAQVLGLGPRLKITGHIRNLSAEEILEAVSIYFHCDPDIYQMDTPYTKIPYIVPNCDYSFTSFVFCKLSVTSSLNLVVSHKGKVILSAIINMPLANVTET